ncbi:MAG: VWA domain-containing protein [Pyrinomonadaceae bacterium]|nr:VWA domain-containing protein [Pyrinomonadaceae bacterium]
MNKTFSFLLTLIFVMLSLLPTPITAQRSTAATPSASSSPSSPQQPSAPDDGDEVVRISTNLVQVDAVVTDRQGNPVTDLRAEDFDIFEDDRSQEITSFSYVLVDSAAPQPAPPIASGSRERAPSLASPVRLRPDQVRRTMAVIVDDLGLSFESTAFVRQALKKFVDQQIQTGDLVAIIRTSAGAGALQQFTSDKRQLYAAIERVRWYPFGRGGISAFSAIGLDPLERLNRRSGAGLPAGVEGSRRSIDNVGADEELDQLRQDIFSVGTLGAINFVVRGMRELPGRKSVLLVSDGIRMFNLAGRDAMQSGTVASGRRSRDIQSSRVLDSLRLLTDLANRASVVIYTMDARGLQTLSLTAADNTSDLSPQEVGARLTGRRDEYFASQDGLNYLAQQTGGFFIRETNDLARGMRRVLDDQRGYYLIGYRPEKSTFDEASGRRRFHKINVRVKRPGLRVRSRTGFYGVPTEAARPVQRTPQQRLIAALNSPFTSGNINLRLTSLFVNDSQTGSFMRSMLHIDGRNLSFVEEADGWHKVVFDVFAVTFGSNETVVDEANRSHTIRVRNDTYRNLLQYGLTYSVNVPVKKAGAYQLRIAVRDAASEQIGSASQFIEVPDLGKNRLALSGIVLSGDYPQTSAAATTTPKATEPTPAASSSPQQQQASAPGSQASDGTPEKAAESDPQAGPSIRRLRPGMWLDYAYLIYNAQLDRATRLPQLQIQARLFRDGQPVYEGEPTPLAVNQQSDMKRIPVGGRMQLGAKASPGEYVLQVIVSDQLAKEKHRTVAQWIDFEIVK